MPKAKKATQKKMDEIIEIDHQKIMDIHGDTSVSLEQTIERLECIREYCDELIDLCRDDIKRRDT